ncbi:hypothetical protein HZA55_07295 [Candidatus Poribacteria bacterium]|nr:hypothetical protein [Candidatus Poribacteria bacterium]
MSSQGNLKKMAFSGFIPQRLQIPERPELNNYPFNVIFAQFALKDGKDVLSNAIYIPDLKSFTQTGDKSSIKYVNSYGGTSWLLIEYDLSTKFYTGKKVVNEESVGVASGPNWSVFFVHFTSLGISSGEQCMFKEL